MGDDAALQRAILQSLQPPAPAPAPAPAWSEPAPARAPPRRGTLAREGITAAKRRESPNRESPSRRPSRPTRAAPRRRSVDAGEPPVRQVETGRRPVERRPDPPRRPALPDQIRPPAPAAAAKKAAAKEDPDDGTFRDGCLRLPKRFSRAASKAGLGNEHGVYGHLAFAKGVSDGAADSQGEESPAAPAGEDDGSLDTRPAYAGDDRLFVSMVERDIIHSDLGVTFDDIAALDTAKRLLNEAVVLPLVMPEFFTGLREPWKGVLLFGPPGTGKTMLAKAVASMNGTTFFNCSAASLVHKYRGESEKVARCLFNMARHYSPAIIFIDEIDAIMSRRDRSEGDDGSRRLKTEILSQMDGLDSSGRGTVMVMSTTNRPWDLDEALLRRLEKRIYVPLPEEAARAEMLRLNMRDVPVAPEVDFAALARATRGFSGADMRLVCREAAMAGIRRLLLELSPQEVKALRAAGQLEAPQVEAADFEAALANTRPSVAATDLERYSQWEAAFGSN